MGRDTMKYFPATPFRVLLNTLILLALPCALTAQDSFC